MDNNLNNRYNNNFHSNNKFHKINSNKFPKAKTNKFHNNLIISKMRGRDIMLHRLLVDQHNNNKVIWIHHTKDIYFTKRTINIINDY